MNQITSTRNERYRWVRELLASRAARVESGKFVAEGTLLVGDALRSGLRPELIMMGEHFAEKSGGPFENRCGETYLLPDRLMEALSGQKSPQGILAVFQTPENSETLSGDRLVLLCSLQDPGNVGMILRAAEALGVSGAILTRDCPEAFSPKVLRASMGGVFRLPLQIVEDAAEAAVHLRDGGWEVLAAALRPDAREAGAMRFPGRCCLVIGNEGAGLSDEVTNCCSGAVRIPMRGGAQSLNAASAASILMWEMTKAAGG